MRYILSLIILLSCLSFGQTIISPNASYYYYTPLTGDATVSIDMVQLFGSETRTRLSKQSPQRWMVIVGVDSTQGLSKIYYDLPEDSTFSYYHSIFQRNAQGDTIYDKGLTKTFHTLTSEPYNLIANGGVNAITLTWISSPRAYYNMVYVADSVNGTFSLLDSTTLSTYTHVGLGASTLKAYKIRTKTRVGTYTDYSNIYDAKTDSATIPTSNITYDPIAIDFGTIDTLSYSIIPDSVVNTITLVEHIDTTLHIDSTLSVDTSFTVSGGTFTPNILGIDNAADWTNFPYQSVEGSNTATITNGWFHFHQDSTFNYHNANYRRGAITQVSDTLYIGTRLKVGSLPMYNFVAGGEHLFFSVWDSTNARTAIGFGVDDGDLNGIMDRYYITYYTTFQTSQNTTTSFSALSDTIALQLRIIKGTAGSIQTSVNGSVISDITGVNISASQFTHLRLGTTDIGNEYVTNNEIYLDKVYADSTQEPSTTWWVTSGTDTSWTYTNVWTPDTTLNITHTYTYDTTWTASNDTIFAEVSKIIEATNTGETDNSIISTTGLSSPYSLSASLSGRNIPIGTTVQLTVNLNRSYDLGTYTDTLVITDNEGAHNITVTGILTTPELLAPTNLTVTHNTDTTAFKLDWDKSLSTHDSTRIYISSDGITFTWIASVGSAVETYNAGTFGAGDKRYFRIAALRSGTISDYTSIVNYTLPNPPAPPESGNWTYDLYVTVTGAGDHSGVDLANAMTLSEAVEGANRAVAGDTVFIQKGLYVLPDISGGNLAFNENGTFANPIVFRGERSGTDWLTDNGTNNTVIRGDWNVSSGALSVSGAYTTITNLVLQQEYTDRVTNVLDVNSGASYFTLDSVVVRYPDNNSSSSYHTVLIYADNVTLRDCYFYQGCRTIIWVRASGTNTCDNFLMEGCTLDGYDNHYAIQCMPTTTTVGIDPKLTNGIIRNNVFKNSGYESAIYLRNVYNYKVYNNVFVNAGGRYGVLNFYATDGTNPEDAYDASSIFANNTIYDNGGGEVRTEAIGHLITNMNGWTFKNNLISMVNTATTYIWKAGCGLSNTPALQDCEIDYNMYYNSLASISSKSNIWTATGSCTSTTYNWTNWKGVKGFDTHTIIDTAPDFTNATTDQSTWDFRLGTQRAGVDLSSWGITTDYNGVTRTNWTMGAYEYVP